MAQNPEFSLDGMTVGYFRGQPRAAGCYSYLPCRGPGHRRMGELLREGGVPTCYYDDGKQRISFEVRGRPAYGQLELDGFRFLMRTKNDA
ncbi:MAG TPA: hypothetical protein DDW52_20235 [Planctomycetaceae bacterium]|nr:hypothetical protein [Planctomycetaceae bacterium]